MSKKGMLISVFVLGATLAVVGGIVVAKRVGIICCEDDECEA